MSALQQPGTPAYTIQQLGPLPKWSRVRLLWAAMAGARLRYLIAMLVLALEAFFTFLSPLVIKLTLDSVLEPHPPLLPGGVTGVVGALISLETNPDGTWVLREWLRNNLWASSLSLVAITAIQAFCSYIAASQSAWASEHAARNLRDRLYRHIQELPYEAQLRAETGDWVQRGTSDIDTTRRFIALEFFELGRTLFLMLAAVPLMISLNPQLTLWGTLIIPVILVFSIVFYQKVQKAFLAMDESEGHLSNVVSENVQGVRVVRAFARQELETLRFDAASRDFRDLTYRFLLLIAFYWGFSSVLAMAQTGTVLAMGIGMVGGGALSIGTLVLFLTYEAQLLFPIRQLGRILADSGKAQVALGRIAEILMLHREADLESNENGEQKWATNKAHSLRFEAVSFAYPDGTQVLHDISFELVAGKSLALVGPTGSGKSTLVGLAVRLYEPTAGRILLDGVDIRSLPKRQLRRRVSLLLQEPYLFGKSVKENIRIGLRNLDESEVFMASRSAAFHDVVERLNEGYNSLVGERGVTLSGGQKQRLSLARGFARKPGLLILDDSLSAVDTETDARIRQGLRQAASATLIIIAHRITTLASADTIMVLEKGRITAMGSHEDLIQHEGLYQRLWKLQADDTQEESKPERLLDSA